MRLYVLLVLWVPFWDKIASGGNLDKCKGLLKALNGTIYGKSKHFWPLESPSYLEDVHSCKPPQLTNGVAIEDITGEHYGVTLDASTSVKLLERESTCSTNIDLCTNGLSITFWFKAIVATSSLGDDGDDYHLLGTRTNSGGTFFITRNYEKNTRSVKVKFRIKSTSKTFSGDISIKHNTWTHIAMMWTTKEMKIYMNGLKSHQSQPTSQNNVAGDSALYLSTIPNLSRKSSDPAKNMFSDLAIWHQKLSDKEIYEAFKTRTHCQLLLGGNYHLSSTSTSGHPAEKAQYASLENDNAWCGSRNLSDQILQLYFPKLTYVCTIFTEGDERGNMVTKYNLSSSADGVVWENHPQVFDLRSITNEYMHLPIPILARYLRIHPVSWTGRPCLQVAIFAQQFEKFTLNIKTEGFSDFVSKRAPSCLIKVNKIQECPGKLGHNLVVLNPFTGIVVNKASFDTANNESAAEEMSAYIQNQKEYSIIIIAVTGSGTRNITKIARTFYRIGAEDPFIPCENCSWILVGRKGSRKPWVQQAQSAFGRGPAELKLEIPFEENNSPAHFWRLENVHNKVTVDEISALNLIVKNGSPIRMNYINYLFFVLDNRANAGVPIEKTSCLANPDNCPGGLTISYWKHNLHSRFTLQKKYVHHYPKYKVLKNDQVACVTWLTTNSKCCTFPFKYKGVTYTSCTTKDSEGLWCSLTPIFEDQKKWGYCAGCNRPLITSKYMFKSSSNALQANHHHYALMHWKSCWSPSTDEIAPYLQVSLKQIVYVVAVATKGGVVDGKEHWVRSYQLRYSFAETHWRLYFENYMEKDFIANYNASTEVLNRLKEAIKVRFVRLYPLVHTGKIALKMELYGCLEDAYPIQHLDSISPPPKDCDKPLGLQSGKIERIHLHASSSTTTVPEPRLQKPVYWSPTEQNTKQYVMITFQDKVFVTAVATQGASDGSGKFVSSFVISSSSNRIDWLKYTENEQPKIFQANNDSTTVVKNKLNYPLETFFIRIYPQAWSTAGIGLRAEFYGCLKENPKFSIVGPVFHYYEGLTTGRNHFTTVSYKYCVDNLQCPRCERQLYFRLTTDPICISRDVNRTCTYHEVNFTLSTFISSFHHHRLIYSIQMFDAFGPPAGCQPPPAYTYSAPIPINVGIVGHLSSVVTAYYSCLNLLYNGFVASGFYTLLNNYDRRLVYCDQHTSGGGWMVFQRRFNGSVDFNRDWNAYVEGFGSLYGEYWLGLNAIKHFEPKDKHELRIDLESFDGDIGFANYKYFTVLKLITYSLKVKEYSEGNAGNSLGSYDGALFSSWDKDTPLGCSNKSTNGWWHNHTSTSCLTGANLNGPYPSITWNTWKGGQALKKTEMKIRKAKAVWCNDWACYYFGGETKQHHAVSGCDKFGAKLLSITSNKEQQFVQEIMEGQTKPPERIWLGMSKEFKWYDGSTSNYKPNPLNFSMGCIVMEKVGNKYEWNPFRCHHGANYICKRGKHCNQKSCFFNFNKLSRTCQGNENLCKEHNSKMVKIYNKKKDQFISNTFMDGVRIGMTLDGKSFKWRDGTIPNYTNWKLPEPKPELSKCVVHHKNGWVVEAPQNLRPALCEKDIKSFRANCKDALKYGMTESAKYVLGQEIYCDQENDGGGWEVIMRRSSSSPPFDHGWSSYKNGFGSRSGTFWHGNDKIHGLTVKGKKSLLVNLVLQNGTKYYAFYEHFVLNSESDHYRLKVKGYSGDAGDSLSYHDNTKFSTKDKDLDANSSINCAEMYHGGWWYKDCHASNLNGIYNSSNGSKDFIYWSTLNAPIKYIEMKIKSFAEIFEKSRFLLTMDTDEHKGFTIQNLGIHSQVIVRTSQKRWKLTFTPPMQAWFHTTVTWSEVNGIRYYEDGRLTASNNTFQRVNEGPSGTVFRIGHYYMYTYFSGQVARVGIWRHELPQNAIDEAYRFDNYTIDSTKRGWGNKAYDKNSKNHHFNWIRSSGCTPSEGTGPCADHTWRNPLGSYLFAEASTPRVKNNYSVIILHIPRKVYRCLRFWYHLRGTGKSTLTVRAGNRLLWTTLQNNRDDWQEGQVSERNKFIWNLVYFSATVNENFESDVAIDDISLDVKPCFEVSSTDVIPYESEGCFYNKGVFDLEGLPPLSYDETPASQRSDAITKCAQTSKTYGYSLFALKLGECKGAFATSFYHKPYPKTDCLADGRGGTSSIEVYKISDCHPPCPKGTTCDLLTKRCDCKDLKYVDYQCRTILHKTIFADSSHYWSFDLAEVITDAHTSKAANIRGKTNQRVKGIINNAVELNAFSNSIILGNFTNECVGKFDICIEGFSLSVWIKHFLETGEASKQVFLSLGSSSDTEKGFKLYFDPSIQQGGIQILSLRVTFSDKSCRYNIPIQEKLWNNLGFTFKNSTSLTVYHNGRQLQTPMSKACQSVTTTAPLQSSLQIGSSTQKAQFQIDELVLWNKWLNSTDYVHRFKYIIGSGDTTQKINMILKLTDKVWDKKLSDLESTKAKLLIKEIIDNFQKQASQSNQQISIHINGFSEGSVKVNMTVVYGSFTYNNTLELEKWLYEQKKLNTIPVTALQITSSTVPSTFPNVTCIPYNLSSICLEWTGNNGNYELFQGYRVLHRRTDQPQEVFQVQTINGMANGTCITGLEPGVNYTVRLLLISLTGDGLISPPFYGLPKEGVPAEIPPNLIAVNTSSTSLLLNWTHINRINWLGVPLGYRIVYWSPEVPSDPITNTTALPNTSFHELKLLRKYITYCVKVAAFNSLSDGNYTEPLCLKTDEDVPDVPPHIINIANLSESSIIMTTSGVPLLKRNGIILNYTVFWTSFDGSSRGMASCKNGTVISCVVKDLKFFSWYNVTITSYTRIGAGPYSAWNVIKTAESTPSVGPDIVGYNTSSTSIFLSWSTIPAEKHNGILWGYFLQYAIKGTDKWKTLMICKNTTNLTNLVHYREYNITIGGFTGGGVGIQSSVLIFTDEDIPVSPPISFTGKGVTSTSVQLQWKPVPYEFARGIILGYTIQMVSSHIVYKNTVNTTSFNVTILGEQNMQRTFTSLEKYTDYSFQILGFTIKGNGNFSDIIVVRSKEDAPYQAPTNFTADSFIWHTTRVNWTLIPRDQIPGICRGYVIHYVRLEGTKDVPKNVTVSPDATTVLLTNLSGYILYEFWISGFTYPSRIGPKRSLTIKTRDWLPLIAPPNFQVFPASSTSLKMNWEMLPLEVTNGIMVGYVVEYYNKNKSVGLNATYPTQTLSTVLTGLNKFNYYKLRIIAQNVNGFGRKWSKYLTVRTDEDSPDKPPENPFGLSDSPTSIMIKWKPVPLDYRNGYITGHSVFYRAISEADIPLLYEPTKRIDVGPETYEKLITGLPSFTEYLVVVLAHTIKGDGVKAASIKASTCRCFEVLTTAWRAMPPYVIHNATIDGPKPRGMIPKILESAAIECCGYCPSHGMSKIDFFHDGYGKSSIKEKDIDVKRNIDDKTDFSFPIYGYTDQTHYAKYYGYIPVLSSSGVAFIVSKEQSNASPNNVAQAVFNCWPLLMLNVIMAFSVGFVIWLLDSKHNPDSFGESFISGVGSGFWFAFITYTTVGYGDKTVVSTPARIFTVFWTLLGLVTFGILMGSFSAAFETMAYEETKSDMMLYGTKVAALDNSSEHRLGLRKNAKVNSVNHYKTLKEIQQAMLNAEVKGALVDAYVAAYYADLFEHPLLRMLKIYEVKSGYGAVLGGPTKKIQKCMENYLSDNRAWISQHIEDNSQSLKQSKPPMVEVAEELVDGSSNIFIESLQGFVYVLVFAVIVGLAYEFYQRRKRSLNNEPPKPEIKAITDELRNSLNKILINFKNKVEKRKKKLIKILREQKKHRKI